MSPLGRPFAHPFARPRPAPTPRRVTPIAFALALVAVVGLALGATAPSAAADTAVDLSTTIDGVAAAGSSPAHPVVLQPNRSADIEMQVTNNGSDPVTLRAVRLTGVVTGLTFFSYQTSVNLTIEPGQSTQLRYSLDLTGLDGQATGLIPARISVSDADHHQVASQSFVSDVRGSLASVYGLFGLALLALTGIAVAGVLWAVATHRMPRNRWRRGMRLLTVGLGLGLVMVFTLSALRVWVPSAGRWVVTVAGFAVVFFVIGYLTPTPSSDDDEDELDESEFLADAAEPDPVAPPASPTATTPTSTPTTTPVSADGSP